MSEGYYRNDKQMNDGYQQNQPQSQQHQQHAQQQYQNQQPNGQAGGYPETDGNKGGGEYNDEYQQGVFRDNNGTAMTQNTDFRRKYPHDKLNKKSEWIGVEKHLSEVNEEIRKNELDINRLRQKELLSELEKKLIQQLHQKHQELNNKKREHEEILKRMDVYYEEQQRSQIDKKIMQHSIAESYHKQREDQVRKDVEFKTQKNEWENKLLDYNQQRIQEEQRRNKDHRDFMKHAVQNDQQRAQAKKDAERMNELQGKMEYNDLIQMNAERELTKEENYRNFYRMAAENQQKLHENHFNFVFLPLAKKQRELEEMIARGITEVDRRKLQAEIDRIVWQKTHLMEIKEKNQNLMGEKQYRAELEKAVKGNQAKERLEDKYEQYKRKEHVDGMNKYKEYLDQQSKEKQDIFLNEQRMTRNEKGLNRLDLQAYKMKDNGLYTMLPGWAPQIGQLPPRQNREVMQEQIMDKLRKQNQPLNNEQQMGNLSGISSPTQVRTLAKAAQSSLIMQSQSNLGQYQKIGESDMKYENTMSLGQNFTQSSVNQQANQTLRYGHNPIFNPMPFNNQNPYIMKEYNKALSSRQPVYNSYEGSSARYSEPAK